MQNERDNNAGCAQGEGARRGAHMTMHVKYTILKVECTAVLRIRDILVWIRIWIRGSMPLTNGSGCGSFYFHH
jgi:hypothetical protein